MADGKTHKLATDVAVCVLFPSAWAYHDFWIACQVAFGFWLGIVLTPDLDTDNKNIGYHQIRKVHPIFEKIWSFIWWPYAKAFQHRSWATHWPLVGTVIRLIYILWPFWLIFGFFLPPAWVVAGLIISDTIHFLLDVVRKE